MGRGARLLRCTLQKTRHPLPLSPFWLRIRSSVHFRLRAGRVYYGGQTSAKVSAHIVLCVDNGLRAQASSSTSDSNIKSLMLFTLELLPAALNLGS